MKFITDFGKPLVMINNKTQVATELPRYAAWQPDEDRDKNNVVETSNDLEYLKSKYSTNAVFKIK